jgi:hypothetical protein
LTDAAILRQSAAIRGRLGFGVVKARDPEKMRVAGRLGGLAKARNRKANLAGIKFLGVIKKGRREAEPFVVSRPVRSAKGHLRKPAQETRC